ncbi:hypothetical protein ACFRQM_32945 [Streptomyces sp. NPDC056831]
MTGLKRADNERRLAAGLAAEYRLAVWRLSVRGRAVAERTARAEQRRAA